VIRRFAGCCIALGLILSGAVSLQAQMPGPFSADMKVEMENGMSSAGKLYFSDKKVRMEMNTMGRQNVVIRDESSKVTYMLMPQQRMYMEMPAGAMPQRRGADWQAYDASNPCAMMTDMTCQKLGTETVDGNLCTKWQLTGTGERAGTKVTVWIDQKTGIPIKSQTPRGSMELTNIQQGPQSASLFEVPAGYQKMDMGNMMQNMQRQH